MASVFESPIFQEPPDDADEDWTYGAIVGGMASSDSLIALAYRTAGDSLVEQALRDHAPHETVYPILNLYRHAIELNLKLLVRPKQLDHRLEPLIEGLREVVRRELSLELPNWISDRLTEFADIDPNSFSFRYARTKPGQFNIPGEWWVDVESLRAWVGNLFGFFDSIVSIQNRQRTTMG